jgi:hypothetical protein
MRNVWLFSVLNIWRLTWIFAASFMPSLQGSATYTSDPSSIPASQIVGPFTASAERFNGRGAMIGVAAMLVIETIRGGPLLA